ncbi:uncharacterized protein [Euphorbia lathyris]|uniref:uncharacterized protein isoform X2 n=1 Tax=Euphorbia lathyris TaxID=212925 RepID=UPI003314235D
MVNRIDESSPYFIHSSENPSLVLITPPLSGTNDYHSWSQNMKMALLSKNKLDFVDGTIEAPASSLAQFVTWKRCNNLVLSWIVRSLSPSIAQSVLWMGDARRVWVNLKERFAQSDVFRIAALQGEIYTLKQGNKSVSDYFTRLQMLWDEYTSIRDIPECVCEGCVCNALNTVRKNRDADQVVCFLKGLNDAFATVRSQIMVTDPIPNINKVFSLIVQHECQSQASDATNLGQDLLALVQNPKNQNNDLQDLIAFVQNTRGNMKFGSNGQKCTHCGIKNHTVDSCYKKHGYPPGYKFKSKVNRANLVSAEDDTENNSSGILGAAPASLNPAMNQLSNDQIQQLLKLLPSSSNTSHINCATASICPVTNVTEVYNI